MQSLSPSHRHNSDRWPGRAHRSRTDRSAVADVTGQQPAPGRRYGVGTPGLRGDPVQLVDVGTGNFGGDHDSFTGLVPRVRGGLPRHLTLYGLHYALTNELKAHKIPSLRICGEREDSWTRSIGS